MTQKTSETGTFASKQPKHMKNPTYFTIRSQGVSQKRSFSTEAEALSEAEALCMKNGREVAVVMHEGDTSRLVKKVFSKGR